MYENQKKVNAALLQLAAEYGVKYICSNDVHFIMADDAPAHDRLICLNTGRDLDDPNRMRYTWQEYLKSPERDGGALPGPSRTRWPRRSKLPTSARITS